MSFVWTSEQTSIISLYSINWLGFITKTDLVYCAVELYIQNLVSYVSKMLIHAHPSARDIFTAHSF